jgi:hypothetical protein
MLILLSCSEKTTETPENKSAKITFTFSHVVYGEPARFDTLVYTNEAGNNYLINEIQYFISDVTLYKADGSVKMIDDWKDIHYVDTDIPGTWNWEVFDDIEPGQYDSISFTFGINEEKNISFMFVNPPESYMFWPEYLGGGYHYLKLNGKWLKPGQTTQTTPFDFHLGIGQIYSHYPDSIIGFVHNYFTVSLPHSDFFLQESENKVIGFVMNIEEWFIDPHIYDHNTWGGDIMQNQEAMNLAKENGWNVFSIQL